MRGVGLVPVMSPMSKSYRKRERSASRNVKNNNNSNNNNSSSSSPSSSSPAAKKPKITVTDSPGGGAVEAKKSAVRLNPSSKRQRHFSPVSGASSQSVSQQKNGAAVSRPPTPDGSGPRSLRPRQSSSERGGVAKRTRRPFYDVCLTEDDSLRLVGRRIKVWWPLDEKWYNGLIKNYDSEQRQHQVLYDDHDEEWLKLQNETFKIQFHSDDGFQKAPPNTKSSYIMHNDEPSVAAAAAAATLISCRGQDENRTVSEDTSLVSGSPSQGKSVSVYVRRRHSRNGSRNSVSMPVTSAASNVDASRSDTMEVQSPIRTLEPSMNDLSSEGQEMPFEAELETPFRAVATCLRPSKIHNDVFLEEQGSSGLVESSVTPVDGTGFRSGIERWPLSRNVAELLRFIEIRSGGRRGSLLGGRLLNHVWRGTLPVWNIGDLFGLKFGSSSTELLASGETMPSIMKSAKIRMASNRASVCMLISWNGFTLEKNARLREVLETSLRQFPSLQKQVCWRNSLLQTGSGMKSPRRDFSSQSGSYLSVTLLCVPSGGRQFLLDSSAETTTTQQLPGLLSDRCAASLTESVPATELVFTTLVDGSNCGSGEVQETCFNTKPFCAQTRHSPYAVLPTSHAMVEAKKPSCFPVARILLNSSTLRRIFNTKWKDLSGAGMHLSVSQILALFSSRYVVTLLRIDRLNRALPGTSSCQLKASPNSITTKFGVHELLSLSKKRRRSMKGLKRSSPEEGFPPPKRVRVAIPEAPEAQLQLEDPDSKSRGNVLKFRRLPSKKGMWCVASGSEILDEDGCDADRSPEFSIEDEDGIGEDDPDGYEDFEGDGDAGTGSEKRKRRRGAFGGYELKSRCGGSSVRSVPENFPPCTGNLLIVQTDRGWREVGAMVELQRNGSSTSLVVSLNGDVLYSYQAKRYIQPGTPNKYTHALMWRGGPEWSLEFPDKLQWSSFRKMHDACVMAQFVKQLPIPYFREVPSYSDQFSAFARPWDYYIRQVSGELDAGLLTSRSLYDMDSDDEEWLRELNMRKVDETDLLTEDVFEKVVHQLERAAYIQKQEVSVGVAAELCAAIASPEAVKPVHARWLERRRKKGMALIRCFQPPPYEQYEALVQAWKADSQRHHGAQQPQPFAFCLRPNGLDVPHKMQRQRSQRRAASMSRQWNHEDGYMDHHYLDDPYGMKSFDLSSGFVSELYPGSPGSDIIEDSRPRTRARKQAYRKPRKMKSISGGGSEERRAMMRTFIAPATAMNLETSSMDVDQVEGDSCSSMDFDLNEDAMMKAQAARKAARIAAAKAARAQELYAHADAAMKKAVACLIEAEALAAAEKAAKECMKGEEGGGGGDGCEMEEVVGVRQEDEDDDDLLLPISNWTQEFGSGLIQKGETSSTTMSTTTATVASSSPRKSLRYNLASQAASLFKGMVS